MATLTRRDFRVIIYYNFLRGLDKSMCFEEMTKVFHKDCPSMRTIERWYLQFRRGDFDLNDDTHTGRPAEVVTTENVDAVEKAIRMNRRITYRQLEETLHIPKTTLHRIVSEYLRVRKLCTLWVPHTLSDEQLQDRIKWSKKMLKMFKSGAAKEVSFIVTGDETWLYYYDVPTKSQNKVWVFEDEDQPLQPKQSRSVGKRMVVVFFNKHGIITTVLLEKSKTVSSAWYTQVCLPQLFENLISRSPLSSWFLHHDNAPAHRATATQDFLKNSNIRLLNHPPYSPDLAPCDFGLFPYVKLRMKGRRFSSDEELIGAFEEQCNLIPNQMWGKWIDEWFYRMKKCVDCGGNYFEKM